MKFIDLNEEILEILEEHRKWFFDQDLSELYVDQKGDSNALYASSREYLDLILQL